MPASSGYRGWVRIGDIDIQPLFDGTGQEVAGEIISRFGVPDAWRCHPEVFGEDGDWEFPVGGFLVRTGDRVVLVDAGVGPLDEDGYRGGDLLRQLAVQTRPIAPTPPTGSISSRGRMPPAPPRRSWLRSELSSSSSTAIT